MAFERVRRKVKFVFGEAKKFYKHVTHVHHRKQRCFGGGDGPANTSEVPCRKHVAWHILFDKKTPEEIVKEINEIWIDPQYKFVLESREHAQLSLRLEDIKKEA